MKVTRGGETYIEAKRRFQAEGRIFALVSMQSEAISDRMSDDARLDRERKLIVDEGGIVYGEAPNEEMNEIIRDHALRCIAEKKNKSIEIGSAHVMFEYVGPTPTLIIIGKNTVGHIMARLASELSFSVVSIEDDVEAEDCAEGDQGLDQRIKEKLAAWHFNDAAYVVVMHPLAYLRTLRYCLDMPWAYFGVLGSRVKIEELWKNLSALGVSDTLRAKVHAPIGFDIGAQTPEEIAIAALAEIIAVKNGKIV